jgi:hypothetical protein
MNVTPQPRISNPADAANRTVYEGGLLADQLGLLKARASDVATAMEQVKVDLISMAAQVPGNPVAFEGTQFRATVSFADKKVTDYRAAIAELQARYGIPQDVVDSVLIDATAVAQGVPTVRVAARKATH